MRAAGSVRCKLIVRFCCFQINKKNVKGVEPSFTLTEVLEYPTMLKLVHALQRERLTLF